MKNDVENFWKYSESGGTEIRTGEEWEHTDYERGAQHARLQRHIVLIDIDSMLGSMLAKKALGHNFQMN